jgi:heterodisulfide reductase subunit A
VGSIVVATGHDLYDKEQIEEHDSDPDVIDTLQFERMLSPDGPTGGAIVRPSNGKIPREVVFVSCVGSRDPEHHLPYCSRVCCMVVAKQTALFRRAVPDGQAYVFYMDVRSDAKDFEEFLKDVVERDRVVYLRGRVSRIFRDGDKVVVWGADTLTGKRVEIAADLVVSAMAMIPSAGAKALSRKLNIISDEHGFMSEAHIKLRPVETLTAGIFLAGTAQAPRDIADTVSSASGAASKVLSLFSRKELLHEPEIAHVDEEVCAGCGLCVSICAYGAPALDEQRRVARINEALCEGCGACAALCPSGAMEHKNFSSRQFFEMIDVAAADYADLNKE